MNIRPLSFVTIPKAFKKQTNKECSFKSSDSKVDEYIKEMNRISRENAVKDAFSRQCAYAVKHNVPLDSLRTCDFYVAPEPYTLADYYDDDDDMDLSDVSESDIHGIW